MFKSLFTFVLAVFLCQSLCAQHKLSGSVKNQNGEGLVAASVFFEDTQLGAATDVNGNFTITDIPSGSYDLKITYIGFAPHTQGILIESDETLDVVLGGSIFDIDNVEIIANKLDAKTPFTYIEADKEEIAVKNLVVDLPFLVEHTPSVVVTSDAGAGVGYTGIRVRGSDATRVNVTINGVPINDSESHGVFWVNMPDIGSSASSIQLQRGVGPSTNGTGAFGATLGLNTSEYRQNPYVEGQVAGGSFSTQKYNMNLGTGLMNDKYFVEGRYSNIQSDGFIDRGSSDLKSWFISAGQIGENHSLRFNAFSGREVTYQSWYGVPEAKVKSDEAGLLQHYNNNLGTLYNTAQDSVNLFGSDRRYNYYTYDNQVDDYQQDHYQLIYNVQPSDDLRLNATAHYTKGRGFFEEFKYQEDLEDYLIFGQTDVDGNPLEIGNVIRRRWLDNDFYGVILNGIYTMSDAQEFTLGGAINQYKGVHFGDVIRIEEISDFEPQRWYESDATKTDMNIYGRLNSNWSDQLSSFVDLQFRRIAYESVGMDNDLNPINIDNTFNFFNPKLGLTYAINPNSQLYTSVAVANREPVRSDFLDAIGTAVPGSEQLLDLELGYRYTSGKLAFNANLYHMQYKDQLVVTGAVNDVGAPVRVNVDQSFRQGIELDVTYQICDQLTWSPNVTLSRNKIDQFDDVLVDYTTGFDFIITSLENTDIALSPNVIAGSRLQYTPTDNLGLIWQSKYVGKQYLDNTSDDTRALDAYWVNDIIGSYSLKDIFIREVEFKLIVNNIFDQLYSSNGYTYSYKFGDVITENYLYPQAGIHFTAGVNIKF